MKKIYLLMLFAFAGLFGYGQILTFEFAGIAGDEISVGSNFNDANLNTSSITRGSGLTASANANRFNAKSWALGDIVTAVSGNNYMEFTITPKLGTQFSISSIYLQMYRSSTGPRGIALRSSLDSYASNLDQEYPIADNTNKQTFTFTFSQANSSVPVTYRIYMWAESIAGSGGIGDAAGDDLIVYGAISTATTPGLWKITAASDDWADGSNWADGNVPTGITDVVIPTGCSNYPKISAAAAATCNNITLKSDAFGDASLIGQESLTVNGTAIVERYVSGYGGGEPGWHFLSSPIDEMTIAGSDFEPTGGGVDDLYRFGETTLAAERWLNYTGGSFGHTKFENGLGYLVAYSSTGIKEFSGNLNKVASYTKTLTVTPGGGEGWNLIGNPYPSAIDWDLLTKPGVIGTVYVVKGSDGTYINWNGTVGDLTDGIIPPHQGFFVEATVDAQQITMETSDQIHTLAQFYKSENEFDEIMKISLHGQDSENNTYLQFRDDASVEFDQQTDAYKLFGWASIPQIYSELNDIKYSINCLPHSEAMLTIPLGINLHADEELSLDFSGLETFYNSIRIDLEDLQTGMIVNIRENPSYAFSASTADDANRFLLHFNGVTAVDEISDDNTLSVYSVEELVYISSAVEIEADIFIYNTNGQLVAQDRMSKESLKRIAIDGAPGIYLISIQSAESVYTEKIYIK